MKEQTKRGVLAASLSAALALAGCSGICPECHRPIPLYQSSGHMTFEQPSSGTLTVQNGGTLSHTAVPVAASRPAVSAMPPTHLPPPAPDSAPAAGVERGHAPDYTWLAGEVHHYRMAKGWQLRYSRLDEEDPYGGSVLLVGDARQLDALKEGQKVHVTGKLINAEGRGAGTSFKVESLRVLKER
jgi:hypothetical protein